AFGCLALAIPSGSFLPITLALFTLIAFNAATHDIIADGIYVSALNTESQAKFVGVQGAAYNIARFMAQGGLVMLAGTLESKLGVSPAWMAVMALVGIVMVVTGVWHIRTLPSPEPANEHVPTVGEAFRTFGDVVKT